MASYCVYGDFVQIFHKAGSSRCHPLVHIDRAKIIVPEGVDTQAEKIPVKIVKNDKTNPVKAILFNAFGLIYYAGRYVRIKQFEIVRE